VTAVPRCSERSEASAEPMLGTASTVRHWLLLEHDGPWGRDALLEGRIPGGLGHELRRRGLARGVRVLLIRRADRGSTRRGRAGPVTCFAVRSGPGNAWIERVGLDRLRDALDVDLDALGRGERPGLEPLDGSLFLVCTHGRRDPCCAERGRPLAKTLAHAYPDQTWESSHIGGDRFAGNLLAFPHGLYFGRVPPDQAPHVARAYVEGRIALEHYRGRSCLSMAAQAAEHFLREERGLRGIDEVVLERSRSVGEATVARFLTPTERLEVRVRRDLGSPRLLTCHSAREEAPPAYLLDGIVRA
jgi:sucrase/ferredoxin-like protein